MVFQNYALYPHMTVRQNMGFALKLAGAPRKEIARKVEEAARVLESSDTSTASPRTSRVGSASGWRWVARSSATPRRSDGRAAIQPRCEAEGADANRLSRLHERLGTTTIYVTHDQVEAVTLGDRIAVMRAGRIQQVGTPTDLYEHPVNVFVAGFIGSPAMNFLPGQLDGDQLRTPIGDLRIAREMCRRLEAGAAVAAAV